MILRALTNITEILLLGTLQQCGNINLHDIVDY